MKLSSLAAVIVMLFAFEASATRVLLIGDSITRTFIGGGGAVSGTGPPENDVGSYSMGLAASLGCDYIVTNVGCSGTSSFQWMPNWNPANFGYIPVPNYCNGAVVNVNLFTDLVVGTDIAVVMLGTNDVFWWEVTVENYRNYMIQVVDGLLNSGASKVILMTTPPIPGQSATKNMLIDGYKTAVLNICDTHENVVCIDTNSLLADTDTNFTGVTAHPNAIGHEVIRSALHNKIITLPEPGSLTLLVSGIIGLAIVSGKRYAR